MNMKSIKQYIIGAVLLVIGLLVGWNLKPNKGTGDTHQHEEMVAQGEDAIDDEIWTCSMHPQIRQNEPGICPICEMDLIPLDNSMTDDDPTILRMSKESAKLAQIETYKIGGNELEDLNNRNEIRVDGTVEMDERTVKSQTAHLNGRIESMAITFEGQYVSKGQKIASIYSTELLAASQELITAAQYDNRVEGLKDAAMQKLKNWKITEAQMENILSTGKPLETIAIYADYSGYVLSRKLTIGDYVQQGQSLYTIGSTNRLWLIFNVYETDLAAVEKGSTIKFTTPSIANREFEAKVTYIDPLMNNSNRTANVRAEIINRNNELKPGMLLTGTIAALANNPTEKGDVVIPNSAILWTGDRSVVYVSKADSEVPTYQYREVEVGKRMDGKSLIVSGLEHGEYIVTHGAFAVDAAAQLNNNMSMMNKDVKVKKDATQDIVPNYTQEVSEKFVQQLDEGILAYIALKDALVNTDSQKAKIEAGEYLNAIERIDMKLLTGDAHIYWMEQLEALKSHGIKIKQSDDVEEQRNQFDFLSQAMINSIKAFGTDGKQYYVQYCPMAKGDQGANWIATEAQIRNPYFGDKMMKCGLVKLELN